MLMSTKLLSLNQLETYIFILLTPLLREVNLITAGPDSPAFGSFLPRQKMYAEGGIESNPFIESSDKGRLAFSSHSTCQTGEGKTMSTKQLEHPDSKAGILQSRLANAEQKS